MKENINKLQMCLERYSQKVRNRRSANDSGIPELAKTK